MTKIKKKAELEKSAKSGATKPSSTKQADSEPKPTKVMSKSTKAAALKIAAPPAVNEGVATAQAAVVRADIAPATASAKPKSTKQEQVLTLLSQAGGVTIDQITKVTGWQKHSVRGFLAGTVRKKLGFDLTSQKGEDGSERRYAIKVAV